MDPQGDARAKRIACSGSRISRSDPADAGSLAEGSIELSSRSALPHLCPCPEHLFAIRLPICQTDPHLIFSDLLLSAPKNEKKGGATTTPPYGFIVHCSCEAWKMDNEPPDEIYFVGSFSVPLGARIWGASVASRWVGQTPRAEDLWSLVPRRIRSPLRVLTKVWWLMYTIGTSYFAQKERKKEWRK